MPQKTIITIRRGGESSRPNSYHSEGESSRHEADFYAADDDEVWQDTHDEEDEEEDLHPSDSASASNDIAPLRQQTSRAPRHHRAARPPTQDYPPVPTHAPIPPPSVDSSEEYGHYGQGYTPHHASRGGFYSGRGQHPGYQQQQQGHFIGGYPGGNQMVPYGGYAPNPFTPMSNSSSGASYFGGEPRPMYDMMPYQQPGYFPGPQYSLPAHLQQFHIGPPPPPPPATEAPAQPPTPAVKEPPPDLEKIKLEAQLAAFKAQEEKAKAAEEQREREAQIRKEAEEAFQRRMQDMKEQEEKNKKEIERARAEAERAARERIEAERKAEEERQKQHAEAMKRAEENARLRIEAEIKAAEARRKKEEEDRIRAEEAAQKRLEAAIKAEADAKAVADKKAAEEAERLKLAQQDAKRQAEIEMLKKIEDEKAAAKKAADAAAAAKAEQEAFMKRIQEETKANMEAEARSNDRLFIKFKDAVGRKFNFPFRLCATWQGIEELIKQAFLQVDVLGPHVQQGHYDLLGPNGEIILPTVWERVIQPDWSITMTMWPIEKSPPVVPKFAGIPNMAGRGGRHGIPIPPMMPLGMGRPGGPAGGGGIPPLNWPLGGRRPNSNLDPDIVNVGPEPRQSSKSSKHKPRKTGMLGFLAGKPAKKKSGKHK